MNSVFASRPSLLLIFSAIALSTASAQFGAPVQGVTEYKLGDYTLKLMNNGQIGQMMRGASILGSVYTVNGQQQLLLIVPEPEASKAKKAFEDWKAAGKPGSSDAVPVNVGFEPDGSAIVPFPDGTVISFKPDYIEVNQPSALALIPGQAAIQSVRFMLNGPGLGKELFGSHTGVFVNGKEVKDYVGFGNGGRNSGKKMAYYLKPMLEGQVTKAADLASSAPNKPANALDYKGPIHGLIKRME